MIELISIAFSPLNIVFTVLLILIVLYWITVILGVLDVDLFDIDFDTDVDVDAEVDALPHVIRGVEQSGRQVRFILPACTERSTVFEQQYHRQIVGRLAQYGIENHIHWVPWIDGDLASFYGAAHMLPYSFSFLLFIYNRRNTCQALRMCQ